jgi:hypothetical protein
MSAEERICKRVREMEESRQKKRQRMKYAE